MKIIEFTKKDERKIIRLKKDGLSCTKVGEFFGCSYKTIEKLIHHIGRKDIFSKRGRKKGQKSIEFSIKDKDRIVGLKEKGESCRAIGKKFGCSHTIIIRVIREAGRKDLILDLSKPTNIEAKKMFKLRGDGLFLKEIGEIFGRSASSICACLKRNEGT